MPRRTSETQKAGSEANRLPINSSLVSPSESDVREVIALRAYELYLQREAAYGDEMTDWLTAEAEVLRCLEANPLYSQPRAPRSLNASKKAAPKLTAPSRARKTLAATSSRKSGHKSEAV
jgi:hypothetical protein